MFSAKLTGPRKKKELNEIQIVEDFLLNSAHLTEEGNGYPKCELLLYLPFKKGRKEVCHVYCPRKVGFVPTITK